MALAALALGATYARGRGWAWLVPLAVVVTSPEPRALLNFGQNTGFVLVGLCGFLLLRTRGYPLAAGLVGALTAVKPHLLLPFATVLLVEARTAPGRRVLLGGVVTLVAGSLLALVSNPGVFGDFVAAMRGPTTAATVAPAEWQLPLFSYRLRNAIDPAAFRWQFLPAAVACLAFGIARKRAASWDWAARLPLLVLVSLLCAPYGGWVFDLVLLVVPVTATFVRAIDSGRAMAILSALAFHLLRYPAAMRITSLEDGWAVTPLALAGWLVTRALTPDTDPTEPPRMASDETPKHRVVIIGGGFGGLYCTRALRNSPVDVTLIDRRNFHLFQPLLYQVATGGLSAPNIAAPLRSIFDHQKNVTVLLAAVEAFDVVGKTVKLTDGDSVPFDTLVVATGSTHSYFGHPEWEKYAPGLKTVEDAMRIRRKVLTAFEKAERTTDEGVRKKCLTFLVIGGGPTGVEMAGGIRELAYQTLEGDFKRIDPATARVVLVEGQPRVLSNYAPSLSEYAQKSLASMGVELQLDAHVTDLGEEYAVLTNDNTNAETRVEAATMIWAAGVRASPLGKMLADAVAATGVPAPAVGRGGHVAVSPDCSLAARPDLFVIGDAASMMGRDDKPLPGVAQTAIQQGSYVGKVIDRRLRGKTLPAPFKYWNKGNMSTIGRRRAVADVGYFKFTGFFAWLAWLMIHVVYLASFSNRVLVLFQWFWNYVTRNRSARLITGESAMNAVKE
jgi:NADH dehydrogenase